MTQFKVGQRVKTFNGFYPDRNGEGTVKTVGRKSFTVAFDRDSEVRRFDLDGRAQSGAWKVKTFEQAAADDRRAAATKAVRAHGVMLDNWNEVTVEQLEAIAAVFAEQ
jgi:hypothetical protein